MTPELSLVLRHVFAAHPWHGPELGAQCPERVSAYVEIVPTDTVKYELDKATGILKVDRPQRYSSQCPALYGFLPRTLCGDAVGALCDRELGGSGTRGDADPLDVCILSERPIPHGGVLVQVIPIGGLLMVDKGEADDKIVAVLADDAVYGDLRELAEAPPALIDRLRHYFLSYKRAPGSDAQPVSISRSYGRAAAQEVIRTSMRDYAEHFAAMTRALP
jgi:inorganic pyrophosphatase